MTLSEISERTDFASKLRLKADELVEREVILKRRMGAIVPEGENEEIIDLLERAAGVIDTMVEELRGAS